MGSKKKHYVHLYYGVGKGKTTAALGLSLRAVGQGQKVVMIQWLKGRSDIGEIKAKTLLPGRFKIYQFGPPHFTWDPPGPAEHERLAKKGLEFLEKVVKNRRYDVLVLDEIIDAVTMGFIPRSKVISLIRRAAKKGEVVLTGHQAPKEFLDLADLVTEMRKVKHYFDRGQLARPGVEY
ncbi:hypothetical protein A2V68_02355 [candidate division Kazan bacterium RBG_13_50_9]|uniref:Cob(I)yrinic acid a,c-diamide adenosyltransferase n=1 Tax=candidate division Kazan bacterium RBG_13_50_9 TaxID=1798535 RepID=A0A1F4NS94_UNCK3|nr:MAG: hypothetical protein A2V68_02355 [candidate division Kazan bacterium RBG_13_50_9]